MWYFILGALIVGVLWYRQTCIRQRQEYVGVFGSIDVLAGGIITELKAEYPVHKVLKHTVEDYTIHCYGNSHDYLIFFSYNPSGVSLRVEFTSMLGQKKVVDETFLPQDLNIERMKSILVRAMGIG